MKFTKILLSFAVVVAITASCRKNMPVPNRPYDYGTSFDAVFESFWTGMNSNYAFWGVDPTDWDAVYTTYKPKFAELDIYDTLDVVTAYEYFAEMTKDLVDGHYSILFNQNYTEILRNAGYNSAISPIFTRHLQNGNYHDGVFMDDYIFNELPAKYLSNSFIGKADVGQEPPLKMVQGYVNKTISQGKNIGYFYINVFDIYNYFMQGIDDQTPGLTPISDILDTFAATAADPNLDGVIIDMRGNIGGAVDDLNLLWGSLLVGKEFLTGYIYTKIGEGRLDYGPKIPDIIRPYNEVYPEATDVHTNPHPVTAPIVVLADINSVSCAEVTTIALSNLPNGYFVGERTWGAQGILISDNRSIALMGGGTFNNSFFDLVYAPFGMSKAVDGKCYEGKGYSPNDAPRGYEVKFNAAAIAAGNDPQFEKAVEVILNSAQ
jgi:hypothetical protein